MSNLVNWDCLSDEQKIYRDVLLMRAMDGQGKPINENLGDLIATLKPYQSYLRNKVKASLAKSGVELPL